MINSLSPGLSRGLAIALLILVLAGAGIAVGWPFGSLRGLESQIDTAQQRLAAFQNRADQREILLKQRD